MGNHSPKSAQRLRGGMAGRIYIVRFKDKTIRAWTYEMPDGKLEQFQVAVGKSAVFAITSECFKIKT